MSGRVVHFEVPFDDQERATAFYNQAFGWNIAPIPEMSYVMVSTGPTGEQGAGPQEAGFINGGMFRRQSPVTGPVITVDVDDIDTSLEQIEKLGGSTVEAKTAVGEMGFSAYFTDPEGNLMGLWQSA
ncbi:MAG: VOC family protein [Nocardioidaceae bacterium]